MASESFIQLFEGKKVRIIWNEQEGKYYFAVADIVQVLTDSADTKQYIKRMRSRDAELNSVWGTICTPHQFVSTDGKRHAVNCADLEGVFRIIQSIPSKKAEPVKRWLAEVGAQRIDQMIDPELTRVRNPKGMSQSAEAAKAGGKVAKNAREDLEHQLGRSVISAKRAADYIRPIEDSEAKTNHILTNN